MVALQALPEGVNSAALDINDSGAIAGWSETMSGSHATLWLPNRAPIDLGTFGGNESRAFAINNRGDVVGTATVRTPRLPFTGIQRDQPNAIPLLIAPVQRAFVYRNGVMTDLNRLLPADSGWLLFEARDISDSGEIVGIGWFDGAMSAFRLTLPAATSGASSTAPTGSPIRTIQPGISK
jgi:probable HAF family extracellular repeat protein